MALTKKILMYVLLGFLSLIFLGPLLFMISSSFKPDTQIFEDLRSFRAFLPVGELSLDHYRTVFERSRLRSKRPRTTLAPMGMSR